MTSLTPVLGGLMHSSDFRGQETIIWYTYLHVDKTQNKNFIKYKTIKFDILLVPGISDKVS